MPDVRAFFAETAQALKPDALLFLVEPAGHVTEADFDAELTVAAATGFPLVERPVVRKNSATLLKRR